MEIENKSADVSNLVIRSYRNDPKAQMLLYRMFSNAMFHTCVRIVGDKFLAEDIMQEAFLAAFAKIKECRTPEYFGSWLKRIVVNKAIDEVRKKKFQFASLDDALPIADEPSELITEELAEQEKLVAHVKNAIKLLPEGYRIVLVLKLFEDYEYSEIAKELALAESSVRSQFVRGKQKLIEIIEKLKKESHD
jgi:RNA polymerase sigma factor (sigma-70 family)